MMNYQPISLAGISLDRIYMRRLMWHAESQAIRTPSLSQPRLNVVLDIQHSPSPRNPYVLEVTLFLNARCDNGSALVFETKMQYTGVFRISTPEFASEKSVIDYCAAQVYPHLRREFANRTLLGGFQGLLLNDRHLETCLHKLFMGPPRPQAAFVRIFGTLFNQRSQGALASKARSGPPARVRITSRRILRSPWLMPVLAIPVVTSLLGGIHWWTDHRLPPTAAALSKLAPAPIAVVDDKPSEKPPVADMRLDSLRITGADWLNAQPSSNFTVVISRTKTVATALESVDKLTMDQPAFLVMMKSEPTVVTGSFAQKKDAVAAADRFKKLHKGTPAETTGMSSLNVFSGK